MKASEIRAQARESLKGRWGQAILILIIAFIITFVISFLLNLIPFIGSIIMFIITAPLSAGILSVIMKFSRGETVGYFDFVNDAIELFGRTWGVIGHVILKMLLPVILIIVSSILLSVGATSGLLASAAGSSGNFGGILAFIGIILYIVSMCWAIVKGLLYTVANYIMIDNPSMSTKDVVEESERLMQGNRWRYVCLGLSFIGWNILASITFGIGYIWLIPYMMVANVMFYLSLLGSKNTIDPISKEEPVENTSETEE